MFEGDAELLNEFVVESMEGLAEIESDLMAIEDQGADIDVDLVNKVFRAIHSIKGAAGFLGLERVAELAHSLENVLSLIRACSLVPTTGVIEPLLKGSDLLRKMLGDIVHSNDYDVAELVAPLKALAEGSRPDGETSAGASKPAMPQTGNAGPGNTELKPVAESMPRLDVNPDRIDEARARGWNVYDIEFRPAQDAICREINSLLQTLRDTGAILASSLPDPLDEAAVSQLSGFRIVHSTMLTADRLAAFFQLPESRFTVLASALPAGLPAAASVNPPAQVHPAQAPVPEAVAHVPPESQTVAAPEPTVQRPAGTAPAASGSPSKSGQDSSEDHKSAADANIRVSVAVLDRLMNLAGELVLGRNQLLQTVGTQDVRVLESVAARINQITTDLQETIMQTRMQPVGNVFGKFTRVVRDLSRQLGKQVQLDIEGKDVELDKTIIESIGDPLTHLVRNSLDHGIEVPELRVQAGKNPQGTLRLKALHQEGKVLLVVEDDGAGIDAARLKRKAVEKGLLTSEAADALSEREALQLIFAPGFSTAEKVTAVSGRGVGMDVVKTNFERLGGQVEIDTKVGRGTTITVRLPLTLAIMPALITSCADRRFAIPQGNIRELVRVSPRELAERISYVNQSEVLRLRGTLLPLVRLDAILAEQGTASSNTSPSVTNIVVVETGRTRYGLIVDRLHDSEEIVVKPLGRHLKSIHFLAGATVLGDGRVAMILDVGGLGRRAELSSVQDRIIRKSLAAETGEREVEQISTLLFSNHPREWFGVPMSVVSRIERIRADQIDSVAGREVLQYRGHSLSLLSLEKCIPARERLQHPTVNIIVFKHGDREMGLIAPTVIDIRNLPSSIDTVAFKAPGVLGSLIVEGHTIRFLDVFDLGNTQHAVGRAAISHDPLRAANGETSLRKKTRILYAEDSTFFRNKVTRFMETEGWEVIPCEDGEIAWNKLQEPSLELDLVITDIEMPNLNGFQLTERIRASQRWGSIPIIAVTSLASDADRAHGIAAGVTEYMVKLNREQLLAAVTKVLGLELARSD